MSAASNRITHILKALTAALLLAICCIPNPTLGQLQLTCPTNIVQIADPNNCGAIVNYSILYNTNLTEDTLISGGLYGNGYYWQVPAGVGLISVELKGGQGNQNASGVGVGGLGGHVTGDLTVTPGEYIYFEVGSGGNVGPDGNWTGGGYPGGYSPCALARGGAGGGSSSVWQGGWSFYNRVMVAGGGGGVGGNRVLGCGRGTGGGGGGGWYGGGGGAAWPYQSSILPTGGTQFQGGQGGQSTYSSNAPYNNGWAGDMYYGGYGGEELQSAQGGNGTGANGGNAGGLTGVDGSYAGTLIQNNFTGQSGAGGSSYLAPNVINGQMLPATNTGTGSAYLVYPSPVFRTVISGDTSGAFFPLGTTPVEIELSQGTDTSSCVFSITITENTAPEIFCPLSASVLLDASCSYSLADYTTSSSFYDNCTNYPDLLNSLQQTPVPGTVLIGSQTDTVWLYVTDNFGNQDSCWFPVEKVDGAPPDTTFCPSAVIYQPTTLDCGPSVNFAPPTFEDNCLDSLRIISNYEPGDVFLVGTTVVNYVAIDQVGYATQCSFTVTVNPPVIDSLVSIFYSGQQCEGDTVRLVANYRDNNVSYLWSTFETDTVIFVTQGGVMTLRIRDGFCIVTDTFTVNLQPAPAPVVLWTAPQFCVSQPSQYTSFQWFRSVHPDSAFTLLPGATSACYQPTQSLYHKVRVTHLNGCVTFSIPELRTSLEDEVSGDGVLVYPNPAANTLFVDITQSLWGEGRMRLMNPLGQVVFAKSFPSSEQHHEIDLTELPSGTYTLEINTDGQTKRVKVTHLR